VTSKLVLVAGDPTRGIIYRSLKALLISSIIFIHLTVVMLVVSGRASMSVPLSGIHTWGVAPFPRRIPDGYYGLSVSMSAMSVAPVMDPVQQLPVMLSIISQTTFPVMSLAVSILSSGNTGSRILVVTILAVVIGISLRDSLEPFHLLTNVSLFHTCSRHFHGRENEDLQASFFVSNERRREI